MEIRQLLSEEELVADPQMKEAEDHLTVLLELAGLFTRPTGMIP